MSLEGGIWCCVGAAALYVIGRDCGWKADALNSVTRVDKLKDLAPLLDIAASKVLPLVVAASGRVGSEKPIHCKNSGLRAVILERTIESHYLKKINEENWVTRSDLVHSRRREVGWYLDDGTSRVDVVAGSGRTADLTLKVGSDVFEKSERSSLDNTPDLKMLGIREVERVLQTGTPMVVVGEAVKDEIGSIRIQPPRNGPFYISNETTIDKRISDLEGDSTFCTYAAMGLAVLGVFLLSKHAVDRMLERWRHYREMRKRVLDAGGAAATKKSADEAGNESDLCVICLEREYNSVLVPCGHMCCCVACSPSLINCPLCRGRIAQVVRTFGH